MKNSVSALYLFGAVGGISLFMLVLDNVLVTRSASAVLSPTSLGAVPLGVQLIT